ncbi:MAG: hypothetical protein AAF533_20615, partial [Acidobacteriota bacterium]
MSRSLKFAGVLVGGLVLVCSWQGARALADPEPAPPSLFSEDVILSSLTARQQDFVSRQRALDSTAEIRVARSTLDLSRTTSLRLNLFPGVEHVVQRARLERRGGRDLSWYGELDEGEEVILVAREDRINGTVRLFRDGEWQVHAIGPLGGGVHVIRRVDLRAFRGSSTARSDERATVDDDEESGSEEATRDDERSTEKSGHTCVVNVLVAYTPEAQAAHGDIPGLAQLAIDQTNETYARSEVTGLRMNLIGTQEAVGFTESGSWTATSSS